MLKGILPILFMPFTPDGELDEKGLRQITQFELSGGVDGIGINGFATEAYKLTDQERERAVEIVAKEVAGAVPLIIGIAPGSTEAAIKQARHFAKYSPAALMVLPPATMDNGHQALVDHYVRLGQASDTPIMVQQSPHIPQYRHCGLPAEQLAEMAQRSDAIQYFKIEGPGAPERMAALHALIGELELGLFGGGGGITFPDELKAGASGVIPGVGFNEVFIAAWKAYGEGNHAEVMNILTRHQPLVDAVSGKGHEYSLHARKVLMQRAGYIDSAHVRGPTVAFTEHDANHIFAVADRFDLCIGQS
ncbi:MAG: dihydrodipicolinate synthase family protein [Trueperaceae bacterium]|nr:dihydrodipicolinate synthase family protein [Trueperaceae bacterium]